MRRLPKAGYGLYVEHVFTPVRARVAGRWMLGVLREWMNGGSEGWCVRIETEDRKLPGRVRSEWYVFDAQSLDPLAVDADSGEVRLMPPQRRSR